MSDRLFIFIMSSTRKFIFNVYQGQTIYFYSQQNFEKEKKNRHKKIPREGGGLNVGSEGCHDQDRIFHGIFLFLPTTRFCMCMYIIVSKRIVIEGGMGVLPQTYF